MWGKGSYLNVALHFLWDERDYLGFDYGHRVSGFVEYTGDDEEFYQEMLLLARTAKDKVLEYRKFSDLEYAKLHIVDYPQNPSRIRRMYHSMMICGLSKDPRANHYCEQLLQMLNHAETQWEQAYFGELNEQIAPIIQEPERLQSYIQGKILRQRDFWRTKSGMKKLRQENPFGEPVA